MDSLSAYIFSKCLKYLTLLNTLVLSKNPIEDTGFEYIFSEIPSSSLLDTISLESIFITNKSIDVLCLNFPKLIKCQNIYLDENEITLTNYQELINIVNQSSKFKILYLSENHISSNIKKLIKTQTSKILF